MASTNFMLMPVGSTQSNMVEVHSLPLNQVGAMFTTSTLVTSWPMLPPSNLQHMAHKTHSSVRSPERQSSCWQHRAGSRSFETT